MGLFDFLFKKKKRRETIAASLPDLSDDNKPTQKQVAYAKDLGVKLSQNLDRHQVSGLINDAIKQKQLPVEWQLTRATKLGLKVTDGMTYAQLEKLLSNAEFNKPPTHQQLKKAKAFGVSVPAGMTYGQLSESLEKALPNQPATSEQLELCGKVGIPIQSGSTRGQVDELISKAKDSRKYRVAFQQLQDEEQKQLEDEYDREMREQYGDALMNEFCKWEKIANDIESQYLLIFRRGKEVVAEVVELDGDPEIIDAKSPYIKLSLLLPKKERHAKDYYSLEWEKEIEIRSSNVLHVQKLGQKFSDCNVMVNQESQDYAAYRTAIEKAKAFSKQFELS